MKVGTFINMHKVLVIPVVLSFMFFFNNWSLAAFVYLSIHGTYSILWLIKQTIYPDRRFQEQQSLIIGAFFVFLPLAGYYLAPFFLISRHIILPAYLFCVVLPVYILGIFLHYVSDAQKYYTLKVQKGLIKDGLFSRTRNPNYLGEILIYVSYALMSQHWLPFVVLAAWIFGFFVPNMLKKDKSMSRYPDFADYKKKTGLLLPKLF